jgi:hypothetical protein
MAALGLMAMMASGASAQWLEVMENGKEETITKNLLVEVKKHSEDFTLNIPEKSLAVLCKKVEGSDLLLVSGTTEATGSLKFEECTVLKSGVLQTKCSVDPITAGGKGKLILHSEKTYVLFEPTTVGGNFATIKFLGAECALTESNNVKGSVVAECLEGASLVEVDCLKPLLTHLLREALNAGTLFSTDKLTFGTSGATLEGVAAGTLSTDKVWSGHV